MEVHLLALELYTLRFCFLRGHAVRVNSLVLPTSDLEMPLLTRGSDTLLVCTLGSSSLGLWGFTVSNYTDFGFGNAPTRPR